jgi:hypothetical protein
MIPYPILINTTSYVDNDRWRSFMGDNAVAIVLIIVSFFVCFMLPIYALSALFIK